MSTPVSPVVVPSSARSGRNLSSVRVRTTHPPPSRWTMVQEYDMSARDDYEEWKGNLSTHLDRLKRQMESYNEVIKTLDREMEEAKQRKQFYSCLRTHDDNEDDEQMRDDQEMSSDESEKINVQEEAKHEQITTTTGTQTTSQQTNKNNNKMKS